MKKSGKIKRKSNQLLSSSTLTRADCRTSCHIGSVSCGWYRQERKHQYWPTAFWGQLSIAIALYYLVLLQPVDVNSCTNTMLLAH